MKIRNWFCLLLVICAVPACASTSETGDSIEGKSTDFFQYEYNSNYYRNPSPYFTLYLFPDGKNLAVGAFYGSDVGEAFAFEYQGSKSQLADIKAILDKHKFDTIETYTTSSLHQSHAPSYHMQVSYEGWSHKVVWDRRYITEDKTRADTIAPLIEALESYLKIPQIIEQFEQERAKNADRQ